MKNQQRQYRTRGSIALAAYAAIMGGMLAFAMGQVGCSTVSGFAKDLGDTSEGIRKAMTK